VYNGLGARVALIRLGDKSMGCVGKDLFLGLAEAPDCGCNVRSTTADAVEEEDGLVEEWREERRRMFVMIDVAVGVCGADGDAEGELEGVVRVVGVAEEEKKDTSPMIGVAWRLAMPTAAYSYINGDKEDAGSRCDQADAHGMN
jgi:hypothetical protein